MDQPTDSNIQKMHRWFAIECNNRAWDLTSQPERTSEQLEDKKDQKVFFEELYRIRAAVTAK
ncbi:MAG: hypothetical protein COA78_19925 [Blastopirellula sp.]|nr:MAG: hypothetical protein COA78_19925 [Blastopirellula sp.]